jgi:hypothetical protein
VSQGVRFVCSSVLAGLTICAGVYGIISDHYLFDILIRGIALLSIIVGLIALYEIWVFIKQERLAKARFAKVLTGTIVTGIVIDVGHAEIGNRVHFRLDTVSDGNSDFR